jgi:homoserine kinase
VGERAITRRRVVRVPASSANLGPGFDTLAAALSLHLELEVQEAGTFAFQSDLPVPRGRENLSVRAFELLHPADGFSFKMRSSIPLAGGLGSSAAAIVAGLTAADHLFELDADLFSLATELEGHPDNVAAALSGGMVICADGKVVRFEAPTGLEALAVVPQAAQTPRTTEMQGAVGGFGDRPDPREEHVSTATARAALPERVSMEEAVFNVSHAALLTLGLCRGDWELLARGLQDRLHQDRRGALFPRSHELMLRAPALGALGATISGAGPTVLVWCHYEQTGTVARALQGEVDGWADVVRVPFEVQGAYVQEL